MINSSGFTLAIIMMACITFAVRYAFFTTSFEIKLPSLVKRLLVFTAPCILTAMLIPIVFKAALNDPSTTQHLINSSYFWSGLLAIGLSFMLRQTLIVIILSMLGFYTLRYFGLN